jgi:hypothetical protein
MVNKLKNISPRHPLILGPLILKLQIMIGLKRKNLKDLKETHQDSFHTMSETSSSQDLICDLVSPESPSVPWVSFSLYFVYITFRKKT